MENKLANAYYSGTSGLILPVPNKEFYPIEFKDKSRLCYYSSLMNSIEINSSFYKIPQPSTVKKWLTEVHPDFKFTFKLFKEITHSKNLIFDQNLTNLFFTAINQVNNQKGCLLVQLPPSIRIGNFKQLENLMFSLTNHNEEPQWKIAFEFRHPSLYVNEVYELLKSFNLGLVMHDKGIASTPVMQVETDFVYLRFHGPGGNYRGSYEDDVLSEYAGYIADWLGQNKQVFLYFNNTMGNAYSNLNTLSAMVNEKISILL
ncbi:DUF72 domain-containing protein [Pedobacter changchengzhani]|uniref:DUF72 domain-containing protein n=1 Tax=Pedobacter changchengzhani TaxID=2529274 RepID=A0A4V3A0G0_9SPHI|nr:DUF72 domain-containing protein [Pedobacter changchengzhani]TDG37053.1 DUF72 domain-containing protein [Pedobacter changchengzhani]